MKVLAVNKFYYIKGGSETYYFGLKNLLESRNNEVIPLSMKDEKNEKTSYSDFFIDNIDYSKLKNFSKLKGAIKILYNFQAKRNISKLIIKEKPDIVHLHIFQHQISPSIIKAIKKHGLPIVYTTHDLKAICPNYKMLNKGKICEKCKKYKYYNCFINSCVKNSYMKSLISVLEGYLHKILKTYDYIDKYIAPSIFYKDKLIEFGVEKEKVIYVPNFIDTNLYIPKYEFEDYFIYLGRISEEKGIKTLIDAMKCVSKSKLKIIGTGDKLEEELKLYVRELKLDNIEFLGFKSGDELLEIVRNSKFMVIPSEWYENAPMSVLEAMALGKPIIGANIGGIPEMITKNNGFIFKSGDSIDLANKINKMLNDDERIIEMGKNSRKYVEKYFDENTHYNNIMEIYKQLI